MKHLLCMNWLSWGSSARRREGSEVTFQYLKGSYRKEGDRLFSRVCGDRIRGNGFKLREGRFRLHIRKRYFTVRVVKYCNRLLVLG